MLFGLEWYWVAAIVVSVVYFTIGVVIGARMGKVSDDETWDMTALWCIETGFAWLPMWLCMLYYERLYCTNDDPRRST